MGPTMIGRKTINISASSIKIIKETATQFLLKLKLLPIIIEIGYGLWTLKRSIVLYARKLCPDDIPDCKSDVRVYAKHDNTFFISVH